MENEALRLVGRNALFQRGAEVCMKIRDLGHTLQQKLLNENKNHL